MSCHVMTTLELIGSVVVVPGKASGYSSIRRVPEIAPRESKPSRLSGLRVAEDTPILSSWPPHGRITFSPTSQAVTSIITFGPHFGPH